jgi:hypothetical protein
MKLKLSCLAAALFLSACPNNNNDPESCNNDIDDDGDNLVDCDDPSCDAFSGCVPFERCDDQVDNDDDGLIDCEDPGCDNSDICNGPEICNDTIDNDLDTFVDCADQDCFGDPSCPPPPNQAQLDLNDGGVGLMDYSENIAGGGFFGHPTEAGDVNGDGLSDVVSCAITADTDGKNANGAVTIFLSDGTIDGIRLPGDPDTIRITGDRALDMLGASAHVADVNGDGFDDVILGAQGYDGDAEDRRMVGAVYVIFGGDNLPALIDLSVANAGVIKITGERKDDRLGIWVGAGDLNDDGVQDLLLGADQFDGINNDRNNAGIVYVINATNLTADLDLSTASISAD